MAFDYTAWLKTAQDRLEFLKAQRAAIDLEISKLEEGIRGFAPLTADMGAWSGPNAGITDAIRQLFRNNPKRLFAHTEIRDELLTRGVHLDQRNPMAAIHQIVRRLHEKGEINHIQGSGKPGFQWAGKRF